MKNYLSLTFLTFTLFIIAIPSFCIKAFAFNVLGDQDTTKEESSIWSVQVGYFPNYTNSFTSDGLSFLLLNESIFVKEINHGYYFTLLKAFNDKQNSNSLNGNFSLGVYLNYPLRIENNYLIIRTGIGIGYPTATINFINMIMIEYTIPVNNNFDFSFSLLQEMVVLNFILPVQLNIGIRF